MATSEQSADAAAWRAEVLSEDTSTPSEPDPDSSPASSAAEAQSEPDSAPDSEAQDGVSQTVPPADATPADEPAPPVEPDSGATPPGTPADEADASEPDTGEVSASTDQPQQPEPERKLEPFATRVDGADLRIPGAWTANGHVVMPTATFDQYIRPRMVQNRLALRRAAEEEGRKKGQQEAVEQHPYVQRAKIVLDQIEELKRAGPDRTAEWAATFIERLPVMEAQAEAQLWRARAAQGEQADQTRRSEAETQEIEHAKDLALRDHIGETLARPDVAPYGLDVDRIYERLRYDRRLYSQADQDYPQQGVRAGDEVINTELFYAVIGGEVNAARQATEAREAAQKAAAKNRETLGKTNGAAVAPVVAPAGAGQGTATRAPDDPTNLEEWRAQMLGFHMPRGGK